MSAQTTGAAAPAITAKSARTAKYALYLIVFVSGAVLMGVEIAGAKILAPGFGTSTFVWGSIIGLFMGSLALGYYLGGLLSDRRPSFATLATIVSLAGLLTLLIPRFGPQLSEYIARRELGPIAGPLIAAFALFFLPSFLMGMVSPYAVKLNASSLAGLGGVAGRLYALSTFGSIAGTLLTTFVLIPNIFVSGVMQGLGLTLIIVAVIGLLLFKSATGGLNKEDRVGLGMMALLALVFAEAWLVFPVTPFVYPGQRLLHYQDSTYHEILVTEEVIHIDDKGGPNVLFPARTWTRDFPDVRRWLKFNENIESGVYPYRAEYTQAVSYTDLLHLPLMWLNPPPKKILVVGGGGGVVPTQFFTWYGTECDVAEIDPDVERVARGYFQVAKTDKIKFKIGDGRQTIRGLDDGQYDIIFLDAYSSGGQIPFHLMTWEFMSEVKKKLSPRGILVTNIISGVRNVNPDATVRPADLFLAEYKTLKASYADAKRIKSDKPEENEPLFKNLYVFPKVYEDRPMTGNSYEDYRNVIVIATRDENRRTIEDLTAAAKKLISGEKPIVKVPNLLWHVDHMYDKGPRPEELEQVPVMCDDFAPVDKMYRPVKRDESSRRLF